MQLGELDLVRELSKHREAAAQVWLRGPAIEELFRARVLDEHAPRPHWSEPRVELTPQAWSQCAELRRACTLSNRQLCQAIGISQPTTFYGWERGDYCPTRTHLEAYLRAIGAPVEQIMTQASDAPSKIEKIWADQYAGAPSNKVRDHIRLEDLEPEEIDWLAGREDFWLTPQKNADKGIHRTLKLSAQLMKLLGFYVAEGSCSDRAGIRLSIGANNEHLVAQMSEAFASCFGHEATMYEYIERVGELKLVNRVAALVWQDVLGFRGQSAVTKQVPALVFNASPQLRAAFLAGVLSGGWMHQRGQPQLRDQFP